MEIIKSNKYSNEHRHIELEKNDVDAHLLSDDCDLID